MGEKLARSDGRPFFGEGRAIFLNGYVKVELAFLPKLHGGHGGDGLGDGTQAVEGRRSSGDEIFHICDAETFGPDGLAVEDGGDGYAGHATGILEACDQAFEA